MKKRQLTQIKSAGRFIRTSKDPIAQPWWHQYQRRPLRREAVPAKAAVSDEIVAAIGVASKVVEAVIMDHRQQRVNPLQKNQVKEPIEIIS